VAICSRPCSTSSSPKKLYDQNIIQTLCRRFRRLEENVKDFTPEEWRRICGIPATRCANGAHLCARRKCDYFLGPWACRSTPTAPDNARCLIALSLITGQIGRPGTGLHPLRGQNNVQGASDAGLIPCSSPITDRWRIRIFAPNTRRLGASSFDPKKGKTVVEIMDAVHHDEIKGMYIEGENPAMSDPRPQSRRAWRWRILSIS